jgi:hypothetical protein
MEPPHFIVQMEGDMMNSNSVIAALVAALAAALGSLAFLTGPAHAYDEGDCDRHLGAANVVDVDRFKVSSGSVDFGDGLHLFGSPLGDAVVCWGGDGSFALKARLYADSSTRIAVRADITFDQPGLVRKTFSGKNGENVFIGIIDTVDGSIPAINQVTIRLFNCGDPVSGICRQLVNPVTRNRGD